MSFLVITVSVPNPSPPHANFKNDGATALGSWADEMDALPTAPAARDDDHGDRRGGRDDFLSSRSDRQNYPPREDLPLPTQPPYTAFVGNLAFDLTEHDLETFFDGLKVRSRVEPCEYPLTFMLL
jgi:translation initiation factor 4B